MLPAFVKQLDESPEARERATFIAWSAAAGESVDRVTIAQQLVGRRLIVATVDTTWKRQLDRLAPQYIFSVNSLLGSPVITQIVFRIDRNAVDAAHPATDAVVRKADVDAWKSELGRDADVIEDPKLKELFLRAAGRCLARQAGPATRNGK
jgi:hypothetical protein